MYLVLGSFVSDILETKDSLALKRGGDTNALYY